MEPIRVLNMFTIMDRGGAETMVMNYYRKIDRSKVQFDFLVHRNERGAYDDEIEAMGGRIYRMIPIYPQNFSEYKKMLRKFFDEHNEYSIIHSHMSELGYFAFKEAKKHDVPIRICHAHNAACGFDLKMIMRTYFKKAMMPYITHLFICGYEAGDWLYGKKNEERFIHLNNAIDVQRFVYNEEIRNKYRKKLNIEDKFVVGHVGRFNKQKNHERLISLFSHIYKQNNNAILLLIGGGELEESIHNLVKEYKLEDAVYFLGQKSDVNNYMQAFDIFLFPSLFEGLPVTMIEAQSSGLQCFISDVIPAQCIISENVETFSLDESDEKIASDVLNKHQNFIRKDMSEIIRNKGFDVNKNAKELEEFYINEYNRSK